MLLGLLTDCLLLPLRRHPLPQRLRRVHRDWRGDRGGGLLWVLRHLHRKRMHVVHLRRHDAADPARRDRTGRDDLRVQERRQGVRVRRHAQRHAQLREARQRGRQAHLGPHPAGLPVLRGRVLPRLEEHDLRGGPQRGARYLLQDEHSR